MATPFIKRLKKFFYHHYNKSPNKSYNKTTYIEATPYYR